MWAAGLFCIQLLMSSVRIKLGTRLNVRNTEAGPPVRVGCCTQPVESDGTAFSIGGEST